MFYTSGKHGLSLPSPLHLLSCPFVMDLGWLGSPRVPGKTGAQWLFHQPVLDGGLRETVGYPSASVCGNCIL